MLIISEAALRAVMGVLVSTTHAMTDHNGDRPRIGTIEEPMLRAAALVALTVITGEPVDTKIHRFRLREQL